ncbi:ribosomal lysine N-methyltransferase 4 isoform X3 [Diospyros lotus]|uniref:ribosomal lysine N-methyltransferase 4 isoform X3 n=1 Tax=Diospyros lotus TaxID=55363 RepID=UPI00225BC87E|nr:ribosomal lysine N-methyltransferase 4 isoform X3 [Diospyros lotus]
MPSSIRFGNLRWFQRPIVTIFNRLSITKLKLSKFSSPEASCCSDEDLCDFLPWLERKAGAEISSVLSIGKSAYGRDIGIVLPFDICHDCRSLFASKSIQTGDCMLKVPYSVQIAPDNLLPEINSLLPDEVGNVAKLAIIILAEQKLGQQSEWAPYISHLPRPGEIHNTIFWSEMELEMIKTSLVYQETIKKNLHIENEFLAVKPIFDYFPETFDGIRFDGFRHAYALVESRAWISTRGVSLIPFADFLNHDGSAEAIVLSDEGKKHSEVSASTPLSIYYCPCVIADREYEPGDQVVIRYGKFSNGTLLLDFGFTLRHNIYDEVNIPHHDPLWPKKLELLQLHCTPAIENDNGFSSSQDSFKIKEVKSAKGRGRGIPQSLRAFARVLCLTSFEELSDLAVEAAQSDGRLARHPLKNKSREIEAHRFLLAQISRLMEEHSVSIESMGPPSSSVSFDKAALRRRMARDLLTGELRVLKSASDWLENYCATLSEC